MPPGASSARRTWRIPTRCCSHGTTSCAEAAAGREARPGDGSRPYRAASSVRAAGDGRSVDLVFCFDAGSPTPSRRPSGRRRARLPAAAGPHPRPGPAARIFPRFCRASSRRWSFCTTTSAVCAFGDVDLLAHTSISTMDRLIAPEILRDVGAGDLSRRRRPRARRSRRAGRHRPRGRRDRRARQPRSGLARRLRTAVTNWPTHGARRAAAFREHLPRRRDRPLRRVQRRRHGDGPRRGSGRRASRRARSTWSAASG